MEKPKKILVTGGMGFIGWHLVKHLKAQGHEVISVDNLFHPCKAPDNGSLYADVRYFDEVEALVKESDIVFHLAAQIHVDRSAEIPRETMDTNIGGTLNILEACRKYDKRMVFASTSEVYGSSQSEFMSEAHPLDAQSVYAASKVAGDRLCRAYHYTFGTKVVILRNFNVFGPWQNDASYGGVIAKFTRAALLGEPLTIFGSGEQERDYMGVDDAVAAYEMCSIIDLYGSPINVGSGRTVSIKDLALMIIDLTYSNSEIHHVAPRPGEVQRLCADITKAKSLGFESKTNFESDLAEYIIWFKQHQLPLL